METHDTDRLPAAAIILIVLANVWVLAIPVGIALASAGSAGRWYLDGGFFMHVVTLICLAQIGVNVALGVRHLRRPVSPLAYLIMPALAALAGATGTLAGLVEASGAVGAGLADQRLEMWSMVLSIAEVPRQYGLYVAGAGAFAALAACAVAAFVRRDRAGGRRGPAWLVGGVGAVLSLAAALVLATMKDGNFTYTLLQTGVLLGTAPALAVTARGVADMTASGDPARRRHGFGLALLCAVVPLLLTVLLQRALVSLAESAALGSVSLAAVDQVATTVTAAVALGNARVVASPILPAAALLPGALLLFVARDGARAWPSRPSAATWVAAILIAGVAVVDAAGRSRAELETESITAALEVALPGGLRLPASSSRTAFSATIPVVAVHDGTVAIDGEQVATRLDEEAGSELRRRVPLGREGGRPKGLGGAIERADHASGCEKSVGQLGLALDRRASGSGLRPALAWLARTGACSVRLLARHDSLDLDGASRAPPPSRSDVVGRLLAAREEQLRSLAIRLTSQAGPGPTEPVVLQVGAGGVVVVAQGLDLRVEVPGVSGGVDRERLNDEMARLKERLHDERRLFVLLAGGATVQHLVDALDAARTLHRWRGGQPLFDQPTVVAAGP